MVGGKGESVKQEDWLWACQSCHEKIQLWSKARPQQCGCGSSKFRILAKQHSRRESLKTFEARCERLYGDYDEKYLGTAADGSYRATLSERRK